MKRQKTKRFNQHILLLTTFDVKTEETIAVSVFFHYICVAKFEWQKRDERKIAAVELVEHGHGTIDEAAQICGFHRNSVSKFIKIKNTLGIKALTEDHRGLKKALKYFDNVLETIQLLLAEHPDWTDQQIATTASEKLNMPIARSSVARIRVSATSSEEEDAPIAKDRLLELNQMAETIDREKNDAWQLELNFEADEQFKQKKEQLEQVEPISSANPTEQRFIERLQQGQRIPFAGSLMHHLFLNEVGSENLFHCLPLIKGNTYQSEDILLSLYFSQAIGLKSIEALKLINSQDFGCLLGMERSPDKDVIRQKLNHLAEEKYSEQLIDGFAQILLKQCRIDEEVFFIDGHFLPYYGLNVIAKGYYTVRRLAMKGNELYVISDLNGRPLFFITESNEIDFRPIISQAADKLIELGIERPIMSFDRGGYGVRFFGELGVKADFVTWAKYLSDHSLQQISDDAFTESLELNDNSYVVAEQIREVSESRQTALKEDRQQPIKLSLRLVVIENTQTKTRTGIFTNNRNKPAARIAFYMLNRWGCSENLYKELMAQFNLNYHPGYDIEELEEQPLVDNPDIVLTKKAIQVLGQEIEQLQKEQADIQNRLSRRKDKRLENKLAVIGKELEEKHQDRQNFEEQLKSLPEKVSIVELLKGKRMSRCDLEKKRLYDFMQFMLIHSYERLQELFEPFYKDRRDIKPVLRRITRSSGFVRLIGDTLIVLLDRIDFYKQRRAAEQLCRQLNRMNMVLNGRVKMKLYFYISKF